MHVFEETKHTKSKTFALHAYEVLNGIILQSFFDENETDVSKTEEKLKPN